VFNFPFEVEHIMPISQHGGAELDNLALSCHACNRFKADSITGIDSLTGTDIPLYNPRTDIWSKHFLADANTGTITGLTGVGRATVNRLRMNREQQVNARLWWIRLRLFP
jgi:hypothetical protein